MLVYVDLATNPRGVTIIAVLWSMMGLSGIFLGLRLWSKLSRSRALYWDDHVIIVAWVLLAASASASTSNARLGFGLHTELVPFENLLTFGILSNVSGFTSVLAVAFSKTSFGITLLRLTDGWMKWFIIFLLVLQNITQYLSAVFFWVSCNPPAKTYNFLLPGDCWPTSVTVNFSLFVGACSAFCDFALALLPWRLLLRFNMYNREKIGVAIAMSMGVFAGITCIVKLTTIPVLYEGDFSYNSFPLVVWGFVEPTLTIVAASIPMMRHLVNAFHLRERGDADNDDASPNNRRSPGGGVRDTTAATNTTTGANSVGGGREGRLAAARANANERAAAAQRELAARELAAEKDGGSDGSAGGLVVVHESGGEK